MEKVIHFSILFFFATLMITGVLALPPIEPCPPDSVESNGTCKCNPDSCYKPTCLYTLVLATNGSDLPGDCCPQYSCENCGNDTMINGKCPCAKGAVLNSKNQCECVDKERKLVNGECICDENLCEMPEVCNSRSVKVLVKKEDSCCKKVTCIECPADSYPSDNNSDDIEDHCICYGCHYDCNNNRVVKKKGTGFPGSCCDLYTCENTTSYCTVGNKRYENGEKWITDDLQCQCDNGAKICSKHDKNDNPICQKDGMVYNAGDSWQEEECTNCTCTDGKVQCVSHFCKYSQGKKEVDKALHNCLQNGIHRHNDFWMLNECSNCTCNNGTILCTQICDLPEVKTECQPLVNCNKTCLYGYKINKKGCEICKCNSSMRLPEVLSKYNITMVDLIKILDDVKLQRNLTKTNIIETPSTTSSTTTSTTTTTTTTTTTSSPIDTSTNSGVFVSRQTDSNWVIYYVIMPLCVFFGMLVGFVVCFLCRNRKKMAMKRPEPDNKGSYIPFVPNNNNVEKSDV